MKNLQRKTQILYNVAVAAGVLGLYAIQFTGQQVVYVDADQLLARYEGMIAARSEFGKKSATWQANIDTLVAEFNTLNTAYQKAEPTLGKQALAKGLKNLHAKQQEVLEYQKAIQEKAIAEEQKMTESVLGEVNAYIKDYGERHGYQVILAATAYGNLAYAQDGLDITEAVLSGLNEAYVGG